MDEEQLRTEYWEETRTHRDFPVWVVFREIGHAPRRSPYLRRTEEPLPDILKRMEASELIPALASRLGLHTQELRAVLWYLTWVSERLEAPASWEAWNRRVDQAWQHHWLKPIQRGDDEE